MVRSPVQTKYFFIYSSSEPNLKCVIFPSSLPSYLTMSRMPHKVKFSSTNPIMLPDWNLRILSENKYRTVVCTSSIRERSKFLHQNNALYNTLQYKKYTFLQTELFTKPNVTDDQMSFFPLTVSRKRIQPNLSANIKSNKYLTEKITNSMSCEQTFIIWKCRWCPFTDKSIQILEPPFDSTNTMFNVGLRGIGVTSSPRDSTRFAGSIPAQVDRSFQQKFSGMDFKQWIRLMIASVCNLFNV